MFSFFDGRDFRQSELAQITPFPVMHGCCAGWRLVVIPAEVQKPMDDVEC
jgi:hypothetical protein